MPPVNPAQKLQDAPYEDLVVILLKQFQRLLQQRGTTMTLAQMQALGEAAATGEYSPRMEQLRRDIHPHLMTLVHESLHYLYARFGWQYAQSLAHTMTDITEWQTTSDFLEIANHKSNAELRISAGATLLVMLGEMHYAGALLDAIAADEGAASGAYDVDAMFALRALAHADGVPIVDALADVAWLPALRQRYPSMVLSDEAGASSPDDA